MPVRSVQHQLRCSQQLPVSMLQASQAEGVLAEQGLLMRVMVAANAKPACCMASAKPVLDSTRAWPLLSSPLVAGVGEEGVAAFAQGGL